MTPEFSVSDPSTWPATLTAEQVADIFQRKVGGLKKAVQRLHFAPRPFQVKPYRWRKSDIVRVVRAA